MYLYKAAVIGAGSMGAEIAQTLTFAGVPAILKDVDAAQLERGLEVIRKIYQRRVDRGKLSADEMQAKLDLVKTSTTYDGFDDVDVVIEAAPERLELKRSIFRELDERCPEHTILASNTSSLSISALGGVTRRPAKVIGMHFFYPAHIMKLVEVIPGLDTNDETTDTIVGLAEQLRKLPVRVRECPGFLVNRLLLPYLNEAAYCLQEGHTPQAIDQMMKAFGFPMGPFALVDTIGFDVCSEVAKVLEDAYGPRMRHAEIWDAIFQAGRFGMKTGKGVYDYTSGQATEDPEVASMAKAIRERTGRREKTTCTTERLLLPMINEAVRCLDEQVTSAEEMELAMLAGVGFPQSRGGILHYADELGLDTCLAQLERLTKDAGERFWPAPLLKRRAGAGHLGKKAGRGFFDYAT